MICDKCGEEKIRFGTYACKVCRYKYHAKWRIENRDKWNAQSVSWNVKNKEKRKMIQKKYEEKNKEVRLEQRRISYAQGHRKKGYAVSPEIRRAAKNRRRARLANVPHESYSSKEIFEKYDFLCFYCGEQATCLDHVVPISKGGSDTKNNLVAACRPCNTSKSNKLLHEWRRPLQLAVN